MLIAAVGIFLMSNLSADTTQQSLILPLVVCGVGMGLVMAPTTAVVMENAPVDKSGSAAGILATMRQVGTVLGISVMGALLQNQLVSNITKELGKLPQIPSAIRDKIVEGLASGSLLSWASKRLLLTSGYPGYSGTPFPRAVRRKPEFDNEGFHVRTGFRGSHRPFRQGSRA